MQVVLKAVTLVAGILISASTYAQQPIQPMQPGQPGTMMRDETANRHLGLFLRPDLGFGYMSTSGGGTTISGAAGFFGFAIGGAVTENVILGAHIYDGLVVNPNVTLSSGASGSTSNTTLTMLGIGPELTYYFMPSNLYLSATLAVTKLSLTVNNITGNSNAGWGGRLALGKEWWAGDHWGLGVVGHFSYASNGDQGTNAQTLSTWGLGLAFSATYN